MPTGPALSARLETAIDAQWGEVVQLLPYHKTEYMTEYQPDPGRQIVNAVAYPVGRGTFLRSAGNASFIARRAEADLLLSVQDKYWKGNIRQHDRVILTERADEPRCEISWIEPGMNYRSVFHLLREKT